jgi:hypothetical protein
MDFFFRPSTPPNPELGFTTLGQKKVAPPHPLLRPGLGQPSDKQIDGQKKVAPPHPLLRPGLGLQPSDRQIYRQKKVAPPHTLLRPGLGLQPSDRRNTDKMYQHVEFYMLLVQRQKNDSPHRTRSLTSD